MWTKVQNITWKKENRWTIFYQWGVHHSNVLYLGCNLVILNSRPITTFSEADPIGLQPSTTGYFLTSEPFLSLIELACSCYKESETYLQIWILVEGLAQCIWLSWRCKIITGRLLFSLSPWPLLLLCELVSGVVWMKDLTSKNHNSWRLGGLVVSSTKTTYKDYPLLD